MGSTIPEINSAVANPTKPEEEIWSDIVACGEQDIEICIIDEEQNKYVTAGSQTLSNASRSDAGNMSNGEAFDEDKTDICNLNEQTTQSGSKTASKVTTSSDGNTTHIKTRKAVSKTSSEAPRLSRGNKRRNNKRRFLCCADTH
ncbi:hypothetical protein DPMN_027837 [Dreissena polymorpha]|uniref:Uncharacterized protein n=1 Tax=Dreissena polymorpha TaxID=45954 RepID=A0A9D4RFW5_DREPO|nr:hypothetical protein DPMN_027837 [Dreissena polymorpha]